MPRYRCACQDHLDVLLRLVTRLFRTPTSLRKERDLIYQRVKVRRIFVPDYVTALVRTHSSA